MALLKIDGVSLEFPVYDYERAIKVTMLCGRFSYAFLRSLCTVNATTVSIINTA